MQFYLGWPENASQWRWHLNKELKRGKSEPGGHLHEEHFRTERIVRPGPLCWRAPGPLNGPRGLTEQKDREQGKIRRKESWILVHFVGKFG